jgi:hypothetical protein
MRFVLVGYEKNGLSLQARDKRVKSEDFQLLSLVLGL